jgi:glycerate dehydrogenase
MKIVVLDGYTLNPGDLTWDGIANVGQLVIHDRTDFAPEKVIETIGDAEIVFTNKTPLPKSVLSKTPSVKYIGVLATGYNIVDVTAAKEFGIVVTNIPAYGTTAVAQYTIALLLELCHHIGEHSRSVSNGDWTKSPDWCYWNYPLIELAGKTMGLVGFGRIGQATAKIAQAFGLNILVYDTNQHKELENDSLKYVELDELLSKSDIVSLHCPLFDSTKGIINKDNIAKMKHGVMIINTSRGPLVVEEDLRVALASGKVAGAAVDVVSSEPIAADNPLLKAKNCIITPHIAWAPKESRIRLMNIAVKNLAAFINRTPINIVNP